MLVRLNADGTRAGAFMALMSGSVSSSGNDSAAAAAAASAAAFSLP